MYLSIKPDKNDPLGKLDAYMKMDDVKWSPSNPRKNWGNYIRDTPLDHTVTVDGVSVALCSRKLSETS